MNIVCKLLVICSVIPALAIPALGSEIASAPEVEVAADHLAEQDRLVSPLTQTSLKREQFSDRPNTNVGEILKRMPGVFLGGAPGEDKDVRLRGLDKEFTRVTVDGVQLPGAGEKREFQVNRLPSYLVEEVRIVRNPTAEFESDGLAGKVNVITRSIPTEPTLDLRLGYGGTDNLDGDRRQGAVSFGNRFGAFGLLGGLDVFDDTLNIDKEKVFANGKREVEDETKEQLYTSATLDLGYFYGSGEFHLKPLLLRMDEDKIKSKIATEAGKKIKSNPETEDKEQETIGLSLTHRHEFASKLRWESRVGYYSTEENKDKIKTELEETAVDSGVFALKKTEFEDEEKEDRTLEADTRITLPLNLGLPQEIKAGVAVRLRDRFRDKTKIEDKGGALTDKTAPKDNYDLDEDYFAAFLQDEFFITNRLSVLPGVRLEHVRLESEAGDGTRGDDDRTDVNPSLHLLYALRDDLSLHAAASRAVNRPKFDELAPFEEDKGDRFVVGNPELDPATSWNYDVGAEFVRPDIFLGVNLFYKDIKDVIEEVDSGIDRDGKDVFAVENVGDGWTRGIELEQRLGFGWSGVSALQGLTLWSNQTFLDSELEDASGDKRPFKQQPDYLINAGVDYTYAPWGTTVTAAWNIISELEETKPDGAEKTVASQTFLDLALYQRVTSNLRLFFEAQNVTDEEKREKEIKTNGDVDRKTDSAGRTFLAGLEMRF
jgi:outer membrane receptor for ferrienterochelin and colicin